MNKKRTFLDKDYHELNFFNLNIVFVIKVTGSAIISWSRCEYSLPHHAAKCRHCCIGSAIAMPAGPGGDSPYLTMLLNR